METINTVVNQDVEKAKMDFLKKYFADKTNGFAIGYLAAVNHATKANRVLTQVDIDRVRKAAYAMGFLSGKPKQNPLV